MLKLAWQRAVLREKKKKKNAAIQLSRGETARAELPVAGIFRLGVNRSGIKGRIKKGVARCR